MNKTYLKKDRFAELCGLELIESRPGYAKVRVKINESHLNGAGVVHGGLLYTLADYCFGTAANAYGKVALTINSTISFFVKSSEGVLTAEATEMSKSNRLNTFSVHIYNEEKVLLAHFTGMAYNTKKNIDI
jgi:uncharacterized domain 1